MKAPPPAHRRILLPLGLAVCLSLFGDLTLYAVLPGQRQTVGLSLAAVGVMLGANRLIRIPGNPLVGLAYDRLGRRRLFLLGMSFAVLSTLGYGFVSGFLPYLLTRLMWGAAWTLINVGGLAMLHDLSTVDNRGQLSGAYNGWILGGFAVGPLMGGVLVDLIGFRALMRIYAATTAVGWLIAVVWLPETHRRRSDRDPRPNACRSRQSVWSGLDQLVQRARRALRREPRLPDLLLLTLLFQFAGEGVALSTFNLLLEQRFGHTLNVGTITLGIASVSGVLAALRSVTAGAIGPLAGRLTDRRQERTSALAVSMAVGIGGFLLLALTESLTAIVSGILLSALSAGVGMAALSATLGDMTTEEQRGILVGTYATAGDCGSAAGPLLAYALASVVPLTWAYGICALAFGAGLILLRRTSSR